MTAEKLDVLVMERKRKTVVEIVDSNGRELGQVEYFKYLGLVMEADGGSWKAVKKRFKVAWMNSEIFQESCVIKGCQGS